jgi:hypothetical protein
MRPSTEVVAAIGVVISAYAGNLSNVRTSSKENILHQIWQTRFIQMSILYCAMRWIKYRLMIGCEYVLITLNRAGRYRSKWRAELPQTEAEKE